MPDDYSANTSTTGSVSVGQTVTGNIEVSGDTDWFAVSLTAGQAYEITLNGATLIDPILNVYSDGGTLLASDDDGGTGRNSALVFTPTTTGTYYLEADGFRAKTGTYELGVAITTPPNLTDSIIWGTQLSDSNISVYFGPSGFSADGVTSEGFNAYEIGQFMAAFAAIEAVINVTFTVVNSPAQADLNLVLDTNEVGSILGYFNPPGTSNAGVGVFNGDAWDRTPGGDLEVGGYGYVTIVHELLHGLGLAHPHDTGGTSTVMPGVTPNAEFDDFGDFDLNQGVFTTMTYNSGYATGPSGAAPTGTPGTSFGFEAGPMAIDIAALQEIYGANTSHALGNNVYMLPTGNSTGTYWETIWDAGGTDEIRHTGNADAVIDLREATLQVEAGGGGFISAVNATAGGVTIANGTVIENATGGAGADQITGNDANNILNGNSGFDTMYGGAGFDTMYGGLGNDTLDGGDNADSLLGGEGDDNLIGGQGTDVLYGDAGNDTLNSGDSADRLYGGEGDDVLYAGWAVGTTVDGLWGEAGNDTLYGELGYDLLDGGIGNDLLDGGNQADNLYGQAGNDTLHGGQGFDRLLGGDGDDLLFGGTESDGLFGGTGDDTLNGESGNDRFFGETGNDLIDGGTGSDTIGGGAGFDTLIGGEGDDLLLGNFNADRFVFADAHGNDTIGDFAADNVFEKIDLSGVSAITDLADLTSNHMTQAGVNVVIDTGSGNSITLNGVSLGDLDATDFIF